MSWMIGWLPFLIKNRFKMLLWHYGGNFVAYYLCFKKKDHFVFIISNKYLSHFKKITKNPFIQLITSLFMTRKVCCHKTHPVILSRPAVCSRTWTQGTQRHSDRLRPQAQQMQRGLIQSQIVYPGPGSGTSRVSAKELTAAQPDMLSR